MALGIPIIAGQTYRTRSTVLTVTDISPNGMASIKRDDGTVSRLSVHQLASDVVSRVSNPVRWDRDRLPQLGYRGGYRR